MTGSEPYIDEFGDKWERKIAYFGVALKFECPKGNYVSIATGLGRQGMTYQLVPTTHPPLPWPPLPDSTVYSERCRCDACAGRLVGESVAVIVAEAQAIQETPRVNQDTFTLRFLESARDFIIREAQLGGYGIYHNPGTSMDTYVSSGWRVEVRYDPSYGEVESVTVTTPGVAADPKTYPATVAGVVAALREPATG